LAYHFDLTNVLFYQYRFAWYSLFFTKFFFQNSSSQIIQEQNKNNKIELSVSGMTCSSCELHIESEVKKLPGISFIRASYEKKSAMVEYDEQKIKSDKIIAVISGIGYHAEQQALNKITLQTKMENCCSNGTCKDHLATLPKEENKSFVTEFVFELSR